MKRSPLKNPPLRLPGQSLDEEIDQRFDDELMPLFIILVLLIFMSLYEWGAWAFKWSRHPIYITCTVLVVGAILTRKTLRIRKILKKLKLGRDGERVVGQTLEALREKGYRVIHDIVAPHHFNVDHVIVGPGGVFVIETKTARKPIRGNANVTYDGEKVKVNGREPDRDPISQAKAEVNWIKELLTKTTGHNLPIRGVVLYPGWYIEGSSSGREIWVLNEKAFIGFLDKEPAKLDNAQVIVASEALARYVQTRSEGLA